MGRTTLAAIRQRALVSRAQLRAGLREHMVAYGWMVIVCAFLPATALAAKPLPADLAHATPGAVVRVTIDESYSGIPLAGVGPDRAHWVIAPYGHKYVLTGRSTAQSMSAAPNSVPATVPVVKRVLPARDVQRLIVAFEAQGDTQVRLPTLGASSSAVETEMDRLAAAPIDSDAPPGAATLMRQWREAMRRPDAVERTLTRGLVDSTRADDYPCVRVVVDYVDGSRRVLASWSNAFLMLPWSDPEGHVRFDAELPHAVAAILPPGSLTRARLQVMPGASVWQSLLLPSSDTDTQLSIAQAVSPAVVAQLSNGLTLRSIDLQQAGGSFVAKLGLPSLPPNVSVHYMAIAPEGGKPLPRLAEVRRRLDLLALANVLLEAARNVPGEEFYLFDDDESFDATTRQAFLAQMQALGKLRELKADSPAVARAVRVEQRFGGRTWIVLGDGQSVLWRDPSFSAALFPPGDGLR